MTGWRIGWMVVPEDHIRQIERLAQNMFICAPHASQVAALHALDCDEELNKNLDVEGKIADAAKEPTKTYPLLFDKVLAESTLIFTRSMTINGT